MPSFKELLQKTPLDLAEVARHLDGLSHDQRVEEVYAIPGKLQRKLFSAAAAGSLGVDYFVPESTPSRKFVRHYGKNSLPVFSRFEKRFARPQDGADTAWGFNFSPVMAIVGPGHFILRDGSDRHPEMHVDYYDIPSERIDGAPPLKENTAGIQTLVYGNMVDVLRRVSDHVTIGRAIKKGKETHNYFLLCREA